LLCPQCRTASPQTTPPPVQTPTLLRSVRRRLPLCAPADRVQALKELAKGERTASALESHLDSLEKKIEELLAQADKAEKEMQATNPRTESDDKSAS
jgi:hypothetical protein